MKYNEETVFNEFRHMAGGDNSYFLELLNKYYDRVKELPLKTVKSLLPIDFVGGGGTYLQPWMIHERKPTKHYPFSLVGYIYDWFGDKSTTNIVTAVANTEDELYRRMLLQYMNYLHYDCAEQLEKIYKVLNQ